MQTPLSSVPCLDRLGGRIQAMAVQQRLLDADARAERRRCYDPINRLGQANVALDVRQRLERGRKVAQLRQAALAGLSQTKLIWRLVLVF